MKCPPLISQTGDLKNACEVAKVASLTIDRALEMRPQYRKWLDESVRIGLLYCDWLAENGESQKGSSRAHQFDQEKTATIALVKFTHGGFWYEPNDKEA